jgi:hypothetical protein
MLFLQCGGSAAFAMFAHPEAARLLLALPSVHRLTDQGDTLPCN